MVVQEEEGGSKSVWRTAVFSFGSHHTPSLKYRIRFSTLAETKFSGKIILRNIATILSCLVLYLCCRVRYKNSNVIFKFPIFF